MNRESWMLDYRKNEFGRPEAKWGIGEHDWLVLIPGGKFMMGATPGDREAYDNEKPLHEVLITLSYWMMKYPVTQEQYERLTGNNPSDFNDNVGRPVEKVRWEESVGYAKLIGGKIGGEWRLPTEAEWEYACRAGTETRYYWGNEMDERYTWYVDNSGKRKPKSGDFYGYDRNDWLKNEWKGTTQPVGQKKPNRYGLYDMIGNVWEWVYDWYEMNYYEKSSGIDPMEPSSGSFRVHRGGGWDYIASYCRSALRNWTDPNDQFFNLGFRLARTLT